MCLVAERPLEMLEFDNQPLDGEAQRDIERGRIRVVRALATIHMVVRIEILVVSFWAISQFEAAIGNDLIHIHICRRSGTALHNVDDELISQVPLLNLFARTVDQICLSAIKYADLGIGPGRSLLHTGIRENEVWIDGDRTSANGKIFERAAHIDSP